MATVDDKENVAPTTSSDPLQRNGDGSSPRKPSRKGRSKSIGPGGLDEAESIKQDAKNRRKSTYVPATKAIISTDIEKAERQAARRKTLANRRVSFAPEATLHTWDVVEFMRDPTTSTDSSEHTRRTSGGGTPFRRGHTPDSDPPSTPPEHHSAGSARSQSSPAPQRDAQKKRRRSSGIAPVEFNASDDMDSSSAVSDESDASESEDEDADGSDDDTGTAMSLETVDNTAQSMGGSDSSTGSSERLEASLRQAAHAAGTRGIEYDEFGDDASMELATEEITNALKPWVNQNVTNESLGSASLDQENVNPFSPAFKAQLVSGFVRRPSTVQEEETGDLSMDMTRAMGGIVKGAAIDPASSPNGDGTMDLTQAVGKIQEGVQPQSPVNRSGQKRRRSTTELGSPGVAAPGVKTKRRRSSVARSSMGDDTMDLTMAMGGIQSTASPAKTERRKSVAKRRSSGVASEQEEVTMELTQAVGGIKSNNKTDQTGSSFDENEELTMELTTVLGGIQTVEKAAEDAQPVTPQNQSPVRSAANTTPKDQERFKEAPDSGPKKLLTPIFQKQVMHSAEKKTSSSKTRKSTSPAAGAKSFVESTEPTQTEIVFAGKSIPRTPPGSPARDAIPLPEMPSLGDHNSPLKATPVQSPAQRKSSATPDSALRQQLDEQLQASEPSPTALKQQRSSPIKAPATPEKVEEPTLEGRKLAESIRLMSTPRKETLKTATPKKQNFANEASPQAAPPSRPRPTPKGRVNINASPAKQLSEDLKKIQTNGKAVEKIPLQKFLDLAGIRFMDLTTTKRRMTTAITPSKARKAGEQEQEVEPNLESAILAGGCTLPELEMYEHACHELKRYISDGKRVIKELEAETADGNPPLIQAYMSSGSSRKATIDTQMRDIKTHARYRSKEMWYAWRSQLLDDLMKALQGIGEGLIKDDDLLQNAEHILEQALPALVERHDSLRIEAEKLEQEAATTNEEEKEELEAARERLTAVNDEVTEKKQMLEELQREMAEQETQANDLVENRAEFVGAIKEADRVKDSCRSISIDEITTLKESIVNLEQTYGWTITSASSSPPTITMTYKSHLQLFFHPAAFQQPSNINDSSTGPNAPISLIYTLDKPLGTTLRFFLQLLRASLQALPQSRTRVADLLGLVSGGWDSALAASEAERRLNLEAMTEARIVSDERLAISSTILLPKVRTKVRVAFDVAAAVVSDTDGEDGAGRLQLKTTVQPSVKVVYGEAYNEGKMCEFIEKEIRGCFEGWDGAVRALRERLIARGMKGAKK